MVNIDTKKYEEEVQTLISEIESLSTDTDPALELRLREMTNELTKATKREENMAEAIANTKAALHKYKDQLTHNLSLI